MNKKHNPPVTLHIGSASILLIFVVMCLICFAALSLLSASADHKLSNKLLDRQNAYNKARSEAETQLNVIDETLYELYKESDSEAAYYEQAGRSINFIKYVSDTQVLSVELEVLYPVQAGDPFYKIKSYNIENISNLTSEDTE